MPAIGRPRNASLVPSWMTTTDGRLRLRSAPSRLAPPEVVSPVMLAFTIRHGSFACATRWPRRSTQPSPGERL